MKVTGPVSFTNFQFTDQQGQARQLYFFGDEHYNSAPLAPDSLSIENFLMEWLATKSSTPFTLLLEIDRRDPYQLEAHDTYLNKIHQRLHPLTYQPEQGYYLTPRATNLQIDGCLPRNLNYLSFIHNQDLKFLRQIINACYATCNKRERLTTSAKIIHSKLSKFLAKYHIQELADYKRFLQEKYFQSLPMTDDIRLIIYQYLTDYQSPDLTQLIDLTHKNHYIHSHSLNIINGVIQMDTLLVDAFCLWRILASPPERAIIIYYGQLHVDNLLAFLSQKFKHQIVQASTSNMLNKYYKTLNVFLSDK